jgi:predicted nucleic acid-binding protein
MARKRPRRNGWMVGQDIAVESAMNYRLLEKKGATVRKTINIIIGTFCIHHQVPLLQDDRDFNPMIKYLGLEIVDT